MVQGNGSPDTFQPPNQVKFRAAFDYGITYQVAFRPGPGRSNRAGRGGGAGAQRRRPRAKPDAFGPRRSGAGGAGSRRHRPLRGGTLVQRRRALGTAVHVNGGARGGFDSRVNSDERPHEHAF